MNLATKTVLLIDDDVHLANGIAIRIRDELGLQTLTANDALTAMMHLADLPDLVVCDIKMPTADGLEICEMMDADPRYADTPIIVMTGCSDGHSLRRVANLCAYYVNKGTNVWPRLRPVIEELLGTFPGVSSWSTNETLEWYDTSFDE